MKRLFVALLVAVLILNILSQHSMIAFATDETASEENADTQSLVVI